MSRSFLYVDADDDDPKVTMRPESLHIATDKTSWFSEGAIKMASHGSTVTVIDQSGVMTVYFSEQYRATAWVSMVRLIMGAD